MSLLLILTIVGFERCDGFFSIAGDLKTLWFDSRIAVVLLSSDRVDEAALGRVVKQNRVRLTLPEVAERETGFAMGSLPPLPLDSHVTIIDDAAASHRWPLRSSGLFFRNGRHLVRRVEKSNRNAVVSPVIVRQKVVFQPILKKGRQQFVCRVVSKRQVARMLCFLNVEPAENAVWKPTSIRTVQLICGKSLEDGGQGDLIRKIKVGQRLFVQAEPEEKAVTESWRRRFFPTTTKSRRSQDLSMRCLKVEVLPPSPTDPFDVRSRRRSKNGMSPGQKTKVKYLTLDPNVEIRVLATQDTLLDAIAPGSVVGLDAEWESSSTEGVALVQLAVGNTVYLLDYTKTIFDLTCLASTTVVGFGIDEDIKRIRETAPIRIGSVIDLKRHPSQSLSSLARDTLGAPLDKSMQCSDWETRPMTPEMIQYAALDAHVLLSILSSASNQRQQQQQRRISAKSISVLDEATKLPSHASTGDVASSRGKDVAMRMLTEKNGEEDAHLDYNRRAGVVKVKDAHVFFVNWPSGKGQPTYFDRKYPNELRRKGDGIELTWWPPLSSASDWETRITEDHPALLFARVASQPFLFCGRLGFDRKLDDDEKNKNGLVLRLRDAKQLLERRQTSRSVSRFLDLVLVEDQEEAS